MTVKPIAWMMNSNNNSIRCMGNYFAYLFQHRSLFKQMVEKDFKGRFKNTIFGYFWHLLNPLSQIVIYLLIFTVVFGRDVPNYWVYVSSGMFAFTFFISSTSGISNCIISNSGIVTKMAIAREIIVFSKVTTNLITTLISYGILVILMIVFNVGVTFNVLLIIPILLLFTLFNMGLGLLLSSITVYIRDVGNAASILFGCLMFAVPIMYLPETMSNSFLEFTWLINPLFYFIDVIHDSMYYGVTPNLLYLGICTISSITMFIIGLFVFKKLERGFADRL